MSPGGISRTPCAGVAVVALLAAAGCGGGGRGTRGEDSGFDCRDRRASYLVSGSLAGEEVGVQMDCAERGPRLRRWVVGKAGDRDERARSMTPGEFDDIWSRIEGAGWRFLKDCDSHAAPTDPIYTFDVVDWNGSVTFACAGRGELPFPYAGLVDELDQAAASMRDRPGDARDD